MLWLLTVFTCFLTVIAHQTIWACADHRTQYVLVKERINGDIQDYIDLDVDNCAQRALAENAIALYIPTKPDKSGITCSVVKKISSMEAKKEDDGRAYYLIHMKVDEQTMQTGCEKVLQRDEMGITFQEFIGFF
uniref:Cystatin domain-containing protein n=1 Tax=Steinernema glaseri TaxID=37863 RepID=A0A1I8A1Z2_9BILA